MLRNEYRRTLRKLYKGAHAACRGARRSRGKWSPSWSQSDYHYWLEILAGYRRDIRALRARGTGDAVPLL